MKKINELIPFFAFLILLMVNQNDYLKNVTFNAFYENAKSPNIQEIKSNILFNENFEKGEAWKDERYAFQQLAENYSFTIIDSIVYSGKFSGRFELKFGDKMVTQGGGPRAEILLPKQDSFDRWYSFAIFFPQEGWESDLDDEVVSQWKNSTGTPSLSLRVNNGRLRLRIGHDPKIPTSRWRFYDFGRVPVDQWNEFVFHVKHSSKEDGLVEVWINGEKKVNHLGPNMYLEDGIIPRWKIGIYKSSWAKRQTSVNHRITIFDNVQIGNEFSTFEEMSSK
jgi:hypothetical protein